MTLRLTSKVASLFWQIPDCQGSSNSPWVENQASGKSATEVCLRQAREALLFLTKRIEAVEKGYEPKREMTHKD